MFIERDEPHDEPSGVLPTWLLSALICVHPRLDSRVRFSGTEVHVQ